MKVLRIGPTYIAFSVTGANYEEVEKAYRAKIEEFFPGIENVTVTSVEVVLMPALAMEDSTWRASVEAHAYTQARPERP